MQNMFKDDITASIAKTVSDVLEGKVKIKEMDPKKHVKKNEDSGMFCVYNTAGKKVKEFKSQDEAEKWAADNHDDLMKEGPEEPKAKGEKEFKAKHTVKKSGEKEDGTVVKEAEEVTISVDYMHKIEEKLKAGRGKSTIDVDYIGDKGQTKKIESKFKVKIKTTGSTTADVTGEKKNVLAFMQSDAYMMDDGDIKELFPELMEKKINVEEDKENGYVNIPIEELSDKQKEYQKVFKAAMKKFGVKSPADFKDDAKKKEFFDYIDKNYTSDNETD